MFVKVNKWYKHSWKCNFSVLFTGVSLVAFDQLSGCATKIVMLVHVFIVSDSCYKIFLGHTSYTLNLSS